MATEEHKEVPIKVTGTVEHYHGDEHDPKDDHTSEHYSRRVVLPMDDSKGSNRAFEEYMRIYHRQGDYVVFVHIHQPPAMNALAFSSAPAVYASEQFRLKMEESVKKCNEYGLQLKTMAKKKGLRFKVVLASVNCSVGETILRIAEEHNATFIIVGSRGMSTIPRVLLGSNSDYLVHHSKVPVCVVPPPPKK